MTSEKIDLFVASHSKDFDMTHPPQIKSMLEKMPEEKGNILLSMDTKSPTTILIISILVGSFGIDRFMLGQAGLGVLKLLTLGGFGIWTIVDWCTAISRTKKHNFEEFIKLANTIGG